MGSTRYFSLIIPTFLICISALFTKNIWVKTVPTIRHVSIYKKKIESAKWLIDAIEQRRSTLYKIACKIVELQKNFLDEGVPRLRTLKMQDVADIVGVHVSTV